MEWFLLDVFSKNETKRVSGLEDPFNPRCNPKQARIVGIHCFG
jgi:hypothetical protein